MSVPDTLLVQHCVLPANSLCCAIDTLPFFSRCVQCNIFTRDSLSNSVAMRSWFSFHFSSYLYFH